MNTRNIHQVILFNVPPSTVYKALTDSKMHSAITGSPAKISAKVGGTFSAFDGELSGFNLELVKDKKIVLAWISSDAPGGQYSLVYFVLQKVAKGTKLIFDHYAVPVKNVIDVTKGWYQFYWEPMQEFFAQMAPKKKR